VLPPLSRPRLNPDLWLDVRDERGNHYLWRYIHYNNKVVGAGTRDEFRLTHVTEFLVRSGANSGDTLELRADPEGHYRARVIEGKPAGQILVLRTSGSWSVVRLPFHRTERA